MSIPDIPKLSLAKSRQGKKITKRFVPVLLVLASVVFFAIVHAIFSGPTEVVRTIFPQLYGVKSTDNMVNVLLLGIAGGMHDGGNLTDTILVASLNFQNHKVYLFSIPRDLWVPEYKAKVNAIYEIGLDKNNGLDMAKTAIGNILGIPVHYGLRVDFRGFIQAVDVLGGIDLVVDNSFDDYKYPITGKENDLCGYTEVEKEFSEDEAKLLNIEPGKNKVFIAPDGKVATDSADPKKGEEYFSCRFEHIRFDKGENHMQGAVALAFVRSRKGTGGEGSDFARSKRQQKILEAVRNKVLSVETLANPTRISELIGTFAKSIDTDISARDALEFYKLSKNIDKTYNTILDDSLLYNPLAADYGGAYVLVSQDDDYSTIQKYVSKVLSGEVLEYEAAPAARTGGF